MREEPMVYINGLPFVLREQQWPMKNLQEYAGIDAERLERMEARLKQDVLLEAGARVLAWLCCKPLTRMPIDLSTCSVCARMCHPLAMLKMLAAHKICTLAAFYRTRVPSSQG
eukprot:GHRQ01032800.1.p2 GENE.GHRQ01032800.1~~GHRQ01032800.1.p2  ORF type:complete len:113 (-),score=39.84 GHRQ01032800.1:36-374(-)